MKDLGWTHKSLCQKYGLSMHLLRRISEEHVGQRSVSTQKETNVRQPPKTAPPPAVTGRTVCLTSRGRSDFARAIFPQLSRKDSGVRVARDIAEVPPLRARMYASGYRPGKRGYTDEQIAILLEFYSLTYKKTIPVEIV